MSTSPRNQNALTAGHVPPASTREPRRGQELWRLVDGDHVLVCELLDDSVAGLQAKYAIHLEWVHLSDLPDLLSSTAAIGARAKKESYRCNLHSGCV
jgi:hypothetical protein